MQQELVQDRETVTERTRQKDRVDFEARITDTEQLEVEFTRRTETLTAEEVRDSGETRTVIDLDEDEQTTTFHIPAPREIYAHVLSGPWEVLAEALEHGDMSLPARWTAPRPGVPAPDETGSVRAVGRDPEDIPRPFDPGTPHGSPAPTTEEEHRGTPHQVDEYRPELVAVRPATERRPREVGTGSGLPEPEGRVHPAVDVHPPVGPGHESSDGLEAYARDQGGLEAMVREENVLKAFYDPEENENGTAHRLLYTVEEEQTVRETLLDLVDRGLIDATITRQPFYSPEPFMKDGEIVEGWTDAYAVVALEGMPIQMTEFSYGAGELELAEDDIASVTVEPGEVVDFAAAQVYTCGTDGRTTAASRDAWEAHPRYEWFDDDWERSVYAALADGHAFEGRPLDLSHAPRVRDAYMDAFGVAPEDVFDNVTYGR